MTYEEYKKQFLDSSKSSVNSQVEATQKNAQTIKDTINQAADTQKQSVTDEYNQGVSDTNEAYEQAFNKNEVQVKLNERYLERKAAEMGLTDSGMNRTQMTANQLSYANQKGELIRDNQKAIDTLAATMRSKISEIENSRTQKIADVDIDTENTIAELRANNETWASEQAQSAYEKEQERIAEERQKYTYTYDNNGNVINRSTDDDKKQNLSELETFINNGTHTPDEKVAQIYHYILEFNPSELETANLLDAAGLTSGDLEDYYYKATNNLEATLRVSPQEYNKKYKAGNVGNAYVNSSDWNYKTNGNLRYNFTITKATNNWGKGIDYNDRVSISYPDGTPVKDAQNIKIKDLPKHIQQDITDRTAGKSKDDTFYYSCDLKDL